MGIKYQLTSVSVLSMQMAGHNAISFTNWDTSAESAIAAGSGIEIAGSWFECTSETAINATSWTAITTGNNCYVRLEVTGTAESQIATPYYTEIVPTWDTSLQGWYGSSASKYIMMLNKGSSTQRNLKQIIINRQNTSYINTDTNSPTNSNIKIGYASLSSNTTGVNNTAVGYYSLANNTTGTGNTAVGYYSLQTNTASYNTAVGYASLSSNTTGINNTAVGYNSLANNTIGISSTAVGYYSLQTNTASYNTAVGYASLSSNTTGTYNTAVGYNSLANNTIGISNTAVGYASLSSNTTGISNTAIGYNSLENNTTGISNTAVGVISLSSNTTGIHNTAIGYNSLANNTDGDNNIGIGANTYGPASNSNNIITLGNNEITSLRCNVTTITALSDRRDKTNIVDLSLGIEFINLLKPVEFNWDRREWYAEKDKKGLAKRNNNNEFILEKEKDGSKIGSKDLGFIAQDLLELQKKTKNEWLNLVMQDNPNILETSPGKMFPILVKALQEIDSRLKILEGKINA